MNWVSKRLFGPGTNPVDQPSVQRNAAASSPDDAKRLRQAMITATSETERVQAAEALGRSLAELLEEPQAQDAPEVLVSAICHVSDKTRARSWMERLDGESWLGEIAIHGGLSEIRLAAAQRVEDPKILERIVEGSRNKDKSVYRHCSELLRQHRQSGVRELRAGELSEDLRALLETVPISLSRFLELEKGLGARGTGDTSAAEDAAFGLLEQARTRLQAESLVQRELTTGLAAARLLRDECSGDAWPEPHRREDWRNRQAALNALPARLPDWLTRQTPAHELVKVASEIESRLNLLDSDAERVAGCDQFLAGLVTAGGSPATGREAWAALPKPEHSAARQELESRWQSVLASLPAVVEPTSPGKSATTHSASVAKFLDQLETKVAQGNLADADGILKELAETLAGSALHGAAESRLQRINAQINELRSWARWSNGQAREQLIVQAEELLTRPTKIGDLAKKIPALREEWKRIDGFGRATKDHWGRFDSALTKAYQPVVAHHAEMAAQRAQTRAAQDALCAAWEGEFSAITWEHADYPQIEARRADMVKQWRAVTRPGSRHDQGPRRRFEALIGDIDRRLAAVRSAEVERCEKIIIAAQSLEDHSDGARATSRVKELQEQWTKQRSALRLDRRDEQKLWHRFRAACDAVFAKRDALRVKQAAQREEHAQARQQSMDAFAASLTATDPKAIRHALGRFLSDQASAENSRGGADPLKKRANELVLAAKRRIEVLLRDSCGANHQLLASKAAIAQQMETAVVAQASPEMVEATRQAWDALPRLPGKLEAMLAGRFARATAATQEKLAAGRDARDTLLLDLEMALGLPSPENTAEKRRRRQLEKLQKRFGGDTQPVVDAEILVVDWYATTAAPDAELDARMAAVLAKLEDRAVAAGC